MRSAHFTADIPSQLSRTRRSPGLGSILAIAALSLAAASGCKKPEPKTRGPGDQLKSFIVQNCETNQQYCQVCAFSGKPIVMIVGDPSDASFEASLTAVQKLMEPHSAKGLRAFAVAGPMKDGKLTTFEDEAKALAELKALRERLGLPFPLTVIPKKLTDKASEDYAKFNDAYELAGAPAVMFADAESRVLFSGVLDAKGREAQLRALEEALAKAL